MILMMSMPNGDYIIGEDDQVDNGYLLKKPVVMKLVGGIYMTNGTVVNQFVPAAKVFYSFVPLCVDKIRVTGYLTFSQVQEGSFIDQEYVKALANMEKTNQKRSLLDA